MESQQSIDESHNRSPQVRERPLCVQSLEALSNALSQAGMSQKNTKGMGCGGETTRHTHPRAGELANHLAQRRVFPPHRVNILHAKFLERNHQPLTKPARLNLITI